MVGLTASMEAVRNRNSPVRFEVFTARMPSSGKIRPVPLVRTDVSEDPSTYIIRVAN
jgi:hypothetical protein